MYVEISAFDYNYRIKELVGIYSLAFHLPAVGAFKVDFSDLDPQIKPIVASFRVRNPLNLLNRSLAFQFAYGLVYMYVNLVSCIFKAMFPR